MASTTLLCGECWDGQFGQQREAEPLINEGHEAPQAPRIKDHSTRVPCRGPPAEIEHLIAKTVTLCEKQQLTSIKPIHLDLTRNTLTGRHVSDKALVEERPDNEPAELFRRRKDRHVEIESPNSFEDIRRLRFADLDLKPGVPVEEVAQEERQEIRRERGYDSDSKAPGSGLGSVGSDSRQCRQRQDGGPGAIDDLKSVREWPHGTAQSVDQCHPKFGFQLGYLGAQRGLADEARVSGFGESTLIDDGEHVAPLLNGHIDSIYDLVDTINLIYSQPGATLYRRKERVMPQDRYGRFTRKDGTPRVVRPVNRGRHIFYNSLGILFVIIGIVGIVMPVLPTTVFFVIASGIFISVNPQMYRWLHKNRLTGRYLRVYTTGEGMSRRDKAWTIGVLWATLSVSAWFVRSSLVVLLILAAVGIAVTWHVATIKPRKISAERLARHSQIMNSKNPNKDLEKERRYA